MRACNPIDSMINSNIQSETHMKEVGVMLNFKKEFYTKLFRPLDNNSVLMRVEADGRRYRPIWCSREYTEMMEGTQEERIRYEGREDNPSVYPDDREELYERSPYKACGAGASV